MTLSELCTQCGLCCDGSLFQYVTLQKPLPAPLLAKVTVGTKRDKTIMNLPCGALQNRCCSEYESRPENCRRFVCDLGLALRDEGLAYDEALGIVRHAQEKVAAVRAALPPPPGRGAMVHAQMSLVDPSIAIPMETLRLIHDADRFIKTHFLP